MILLIVALGLVVVALALAFYAWFMPGWISVQAEVIRTGQGSFGTLFGTLGPFGRMLGWTLLKGVLIVVIVVAVGAPAVLAIAGLGEGNMLAVGLGATVAVIAAIGATWVSIGLYYGDHAVVLDGAGPFDALAAGWDLVSGRRLSFLIFGFIVLVVTALFALSGVLACVIGLVVTIPLSWAWIDLSFTEAYLRLTRPQEEGWAIDTM